MNYIDLGLPSGTLWAKEDFKLNDRTLISYEAVPKDILLPTVEQAQELLTECTLVGVYRKSSRLTYVFVGPNGNSIQFTTQGWTLNTSLAEVRNIDHGYYWINSATTGSVGCLVLRPNPTILYVSKSRYRHSVRQVYNPGKFVTIF